ncbi:MAG: thioredoxin domain-containing protein [Kofleriaceae bacterium]|nr:thioredoxin domain-containing protein [Kofleriaceae bacterium]
MRYIPTWAVTSVLLSACGAATPASPTVREQQLQKERDAAIARAESAERRMADMETSVARATVATLKQLEGIAAGMQAEATARNATAPAPPALRSPDPLAVYAIEPGTSPSLGPADALVTIIRYAEYACLYCEKSRATMDALRKKYGSQLRIVYKSFVVHSKTATAPALAACAAQRQGKWKQMDGLLWTNIFEPRAFDTDWDDGQGNTAPCWEHDTCRNIEAQARVLRLNMAKFRRDLRDCKPEIDAEMQGATALGIGGTPSFFINGRFIAGALPQPTFETLIDAELKRATAAVQNGTPAAQYYQRHVLDTGLPALGVTPMP